VSSPTTGQGAPIVAGAATSVAPTSLPTTSSAAASTSSSTSTTGTTSTTVPAAPASLAVSPARIDLGAAGTTATLTLRNGGDEPLAWTAGASAAWLRVSPSSGRLEGGERARLSLSASRDGLPEGDGDGEVELAWDGPARSVAVALRVEHRPEIGGLSASPPQIRISPCTPSTSLVEATVSDESALSSVVLEWGRQQVPMTPRAGSWFARLGPVPTEGSVPWQVVATDARGNTASAAGPAVRVLGCP
jgi:hypothetical protein